MKNRINASLIMILFLCILFTNCQKSGKNKPVVSSNDSSASTSIQKTDADINPADIQPAPGPDDEKLSERFPEYLALFDGESPDIPPDLADLYLAGIYELYVHFKEGMEQERYDERVFANKIEYKTDIMYALTVRYLKHEPGNQNYDDTFLVTYDTKGRMIDSMCILSTRKGDDFGEGQVYEFKSSNIFDVWSYNSEFKAEPGGKNNVATTNTDRTGYVITDEGFIKIRD
jgi:hypothetical protein